MVHEWCNLRRHRGTEEEEALLTAEDRGQGAESSMIDRVRRDSVKVWNTQDESREAHFRHFGDARRMLQRSEAGVRRARVAVLRVVRCCHNTSNQNPAPCVMRDSVAVTPDSRLSSLASRVRSRASTAQHQHRAQRFEDQGAVCEAFTQLPRTARATAMCRESTRE